MKDRSVLQIQSVVVHVVPLVLLASAFFTPWWYVDDGNHKGLFYYWTNGTGWALRVIDQATIGLEGTALSIAFLACLYSLVSVCLYGPDEWDIIDNDQTPCYACNLLGFYCCSLGLYPLTGVLTLSGCIRFGILFYTENLGISFYICTIAGLMHFLMMFVCGCDACCKSSGEDMVFRTFVVDMYMDQ